MLGEKKLKKDVTILIVEDHPIFRKGLVQLINNEEHLDVLGEEEDYLDGLAAVKKLKPDFVIVDISLKNSSGIDLIKDIKLYFPDLSVLALSLHDETIYAERVLKAGAMGYLMKQEAPEVVLKAIYQILEGNVFISDAMSSRILRKFVDGKDKAEESPVDRLTDRELEVYQLIGQGFSTREIADKLYISIKTVENHRAHIKEKLNLKNSIELIQQATLWVQID
jgi:DNA-binding NarL/FixJ family response regulator